MSGRSQTLSLIGQKRAIGPRRLPLRTIVIVQTRMEESYPWENYKFPSPFSNDLVERSPYRSLSNGKEIDTGLAAWSPFGGGINMPTLQKFADRGLTYSQWSSSSIFAIPSPTGVRTR